MSTPTPEERADPELLDEARRELRGLLDGLRGDLARYLYLRGRVRPQLRTSLDEAAKDVGDAIHRLCALLGLSERERAFVSALADDAADFDFLQVFADWLEEEGRTRDGARVRRLVPRDGDVLVWRVPAVDSAGQDVALRGYQDVAQHLHKGLAARGVDTAWVVLPDGADLSAADPEQMRAAGWVRVDDVRRVLRDLQDEIPLLPALVDPEDVIREAMEAHFPTPEDA